MSRTCINAAPSLITGHIYSKWMPLSRCLESNGFKKWSQTHICHVVCAGSWGAALTDVLLVCSWCMSHVSSGCGIRQSPSRGGVITWAGSRLLPHTQVIGTLWKGLWHFTDVHLRRFKYATTPISRFWCGSQSERKRSEEFKRLFLGARQMSNFESESEIRKRSDGSV